MGFGGGSFKLRGTEGLVENGKVMERYEVSEMLLALVDVSGERKIACTNRHEPRFRLPMTSLSYLRLCVDWTRTKARGLIITYSSTTQS